MKNNKKKKLRFNFIFNILLTLVFTVFVLVGYYYGEMNNALDFKLNTSTVLFTSLFIVMSVGVVFHTKLNVKKKKNRIQFYLLALLVIVVLAFSLVQPLFFGKIMWLNILMKVLVFFVEALLANVLILTMVRTYVDAVTNKSAVQALTKKEMNTITSLFGFYVIFMSALPVMILQRVTLYEKVMLAGAFGLASLVLTLINFIHIKSKLHSVDDDKVEEYRYLNMRANVLPKYAEKYETEIQELIQLNNGLRQSIEKEEMKREEFVTLGNEKPSVERKMAEVVEKLAIYSREELEQRKTNSTKKQETIRKNVWVEHFAERYKTCEEQIAQNEEQLKNLKNEYTNLTEALGKRKIMLEKHEYQLIELLDEQSSRKELRNEISETKESLHLELANEENDEKQLKNIQSKIDKLIKKEATLDLEVSEFEIKITKSRTDLEASNAKIVTMESAELPDLQYVMTSVEEQLTILKSEHEEIESAYAKLIETNTELQGIDEVILTTEQQITIIDELEAEKLSLHEKLTIDTIQEISEIDESVGETLSVIADNTLDIESITEIKTKTNYKIKELQEQIINVESHLF